MPPGLWLLASRFQLPNQRFDRSIPHFVDTQTHGVRDLRVDAQAAAFLALLVLPVVLIADLPASTEAGLLVGALAAAGRSRLTYRHLQRS